MHLNVTALFNQRLSHVQHITILLQEYLNVEIWNFMLEEAGSFYICSKNLCAGCWTIITKALYVIESRLWIKIQAREILDGLVGTRRLLGLNFLPPKTPQPSPLLPQCTKNSPSAPLLCINLHVLPRHSSWHYHRPSHHHLVSLTIIDAGYQVIRYSIVFSLLRDFWITFTPCSGPCKIDRQFLKTIFTLN